MRMLKVNKELPEMNDRFHLFCDFFSRLTDFLRKSQKKVKENVCVCVLKETELITEFPLGNFFVSIFRHAFL